MDDEKLINEIVNENNSHPINRETKGAYYDFDNTLANGPKYNDPIKQREQ